MAYEYEHTLRNYLIGHRNVRPNFDGFEILRSLDELQEVYRKAKAFEEIKLRYEKEYYAEDFYKSLYHPHNFDNSEYLSDVENILYFKEERFVTLEDKQND